MKKIAIVRKGDFYLYAYDIIDELSSRGFDVTAIVSIDKSEENVIYDDLLNRITGKARCIRIKDISKRNYLRAKGLFNKFGLSSEALIVSPYLVYKTRRLLRREKFDYIIALGQESFYWAYQSFPEQRHRILYHNLEIIYKGHPMTKDPTWNRIVQFETNVLPGIGGLIIQDRQRADILLRDVRNFPSEKLIYFPVSINEPIVRTKGSYLIDKFGLSPEDKVVLYFGGIWQGRFLDEIVNDASALPDGVKVVIHGGRGSFQLQANNERIIVSADKLLFSQVTGLISSAHIGLAFYSSDNFNDQYTAYSSEKISRYCQCGVPFIAFDNENYAHFKGQYDCCILINDINEMSTAIRKLLDNYAYYQANAWLAFENLFDYKKQINTIINFLQK